MAQYELRRLRRDHTHTGSEFFDAPSDQAAVAKAMETQAAAEDGSIFALYTDAGSMMVQIYPPETVTVVPA